MSSAASISTDAYHQAYQHYVAGRLEQAEELLHSLLDLQADHADALNMLGAILFNREGPQSRAHEYLEQSLRLKPENPNCHNNLGTLRWAQGRLDEAAEHFREAVALNPKHASALYNLGKVLQAQGQIPKAADAYRRSLALNEGQPDVHNSLGIILRMQGKFGEAIDATRRAIELAPDRAELYANLGNALAELGEGAQEQVIAAYQKALELDPKRADFHASLGGILQNQGDLDRAVVEYRKALKLSADSWGAFNNLGTALLAQKKPDQALAVLQQALALQPDSPGINFNIGRALHDLEDYSESLKYFEQALTLRPGWAEAYVNLGNALFSVLRWEESLVAYDRALELKGSLAQAHCNRGLVLPTQRRWIDALKAFDRAISITPDYPMARFARGMLLLKLGRFQAGWRDYEWRFEAVNFDYLPEVEWDKPEWDGSPFADKTVVIYHDQGMGDAIHFSRYLPMVKALGGRVLLMCGPPLFRLFETLEGVDGLMSRREGLSMEGIDLHVPLLSLPRIFGTELESIPAEVPYLQADPELVESWGRRVHQDAFKVGLVWEGNRDQGDNKYRSCTLVDYAPLVQVPGVVFYSLQKGPAAEQTVHSPVGMEIVDYTDDFHDFADTAALIRNLDLVITVDTAVAHLTGALGHPVWTVLWSNHCWRYLLDRDDSPWYPSMRLYRQPRMGDWASVMERVATDLADRLA